MSIRYLLQRIFLLSFLISVPTPSLAQVKNTTANAGGANESSVDFTRYIRSWRGQPGDLQQKVNALDAAPVQAVCIPVLFGVELKDINPNFGDPRSNGRIHVGQDIMAVKGTPIISPTKAVVLRTGTGIGEGLYVYTANPGGETFVYMHLDAFGEGITSGTILEKGSLIGYVGNTGNASGGAAHLHFEVHDANNIAVDPFGRLTRELTLQEKMTYLSYIFLKNADPTSLSSLLVTNFRSTFIDAQSQNILIPQIIQSTLKTTPISTNPAPLNITPVLPVGELALGSMGSEVVAMQQLLISKRVGPLGATLVLAGATGYFGPITQNALTEYQVVMNINPPNGYYGSSTKTLLASSPIFVPLNPTIPNKPTIPAVIVFSANLYKGLISEDVRILQQVLNKNGFTVALSGLGSVGKETNLFGAGTLQAVIAFQKAKGITPSAGYVGPITGSALNLISQ